MNNEVKSRLNEVLETSKLKEEELTGLILEFHLRVPNIVHADFSRKEFPSKEEIRVAHESEDKWYEENIPDNWKIMEMEFDRPDAEDTDRRSRLWLRVEVL